MRFFLVFILLGMVTGCAEMGAALSQMNEDMGAQCRTYIVSYAVYYEGEYHDNKYYYGKASNKYKEKRWLDRRQDYYGNRFQFGIYYDTSPITGAKYKFDVQCGSYY